MARADIKSAERAQRADLADVALVDGPTCAAVGGMSLSWWSDEVRAGRAPAPVIRETRCTRWRLVDVRSYWIARAECSMTGEATDVLIAKANKASAAAKAKRAAEAALVAAESK